MIKAAITRKLLDAPYRFGSWQDEEAVINQEGEDFKKLLDEKCGWSAIIPYSRYEELLEKEYRLEGLDK